MRLIPEPQKKGYAKSFDGTPIYWELHGRDLQDGTAKRPMVFCYGLVCSMNQWRLQLDRYSKDHPCILFDYRGHHDSGTPTQKSLINISACGKDISAVLQHLDVKDSCHVWGHSMGCNVALEFALAEPQRVRSLILCCGTPDNPFQNMFGSDIPAKIVKPLFNFIDEYPEPFMKFWDLFRSKPQITHVTAHLAGFNTDTSTRDDIAAYAEAVCDVPSETFYALLKDLSLGKTRAILPRIHTPTIVVAGALDRVTPPSEQKELARLLPKSFYVEIPAGSHNVQLDFGEYVCLKVEALLKEQNLE